MNELCGKLHCCGESVDNLHAVKTHLHVVILNKIIWKSDPNFKVKLAIHIINPQKMVNDATIVGPEYEKLTNVIEINSSIGFHKFATEIAINEGNYIALEIYDIQNTSNDLNKSSVNYDGSLPLSASLVLQNDQKNNFSL